MCKRGDIYSVDFGNNHDSHKQSGIRPAIMNKNLYPPFEMGAEAKP